jgi:hypothetical protein
VSIHHWASLLFFRHPCWQCLQKLVFLQWHFYLDFWVKNQDHYWIWSRSVANFNVLFFCCLCSRWIYIRGEMISTLISQILLATSACCEAVVRNKCRDHFSYTIYCSCSLFGAFCCLWGIFVLVSPLILYIYIYIYIYISVCRIVVNVIFILSPLLKQKNSSWFS